MAGGNGRSLRDPTDQRHRPARFPIAKTLERPRRELGPVRLGRSKDTTFAAPFAFDYSASCGTPSMIGTSASDGGMTQRIMFSDESRSNFNADDGRSSIWRRSACACGREGASTVSLVEWKANTRAGGRAARALSSHARSLPFEHHSKSGMNPCGLRRASPTPGGKRVNRTAASPLPPEGRMALFSGRYASHVSTAAPTRQCPTVSRRPPLAETTTPAARGQEPTAQWYGGDRKVILGPTGIATPLCVIF
ncbi:hypothetical protein PR048_002650 [Dryococelus australis]|uniref:Uncharacterized protein n=1 Tax=Dryococelus australis TaxID=614101 RepID=A0ABQ9IKT8_9NEOP|nr:hypothetical protein PR048_002650 [Dryococelus australis]